METRNINKVPFNLRNTPPPCNFLFRGARAIILYAVALCLSTASLQAQVLVIDVDIHRGILTGIAHFLLNSDTPGHVRVGIALRSASAPTTLAQLYALSPGDASRIRAVRITQNFDIGGLQPNTEYTAYAVLVNSPLLRGATQLSPIVDVDFTTETLDLSFFLSNRAQTSTTIYISTSNRNSAGIEATHTVHWGVALATAPAPRTLTAIQALSNSGSRMERGAVNLTGLTLNSRYTFYALVVSSGNALLSDIESTSFTTQNLPSALSLDSFGRITHNSAAISVRSSVLGTVHWGVALESASAPTSLAEIRALSPSGTVDISTTGVRETISITGLMADTEYRLYAILTDGTGTESNVLSLISQPNRRGTLSTFPAALTITSAPPAPNSASITISSTRTGTAHYGVVLATAFPPTTIGAIQALSLSGLVDISTANSPVTVNITGLTTETEYIAYVVLSNGTGRFSTRLSAVTPSTAFTTERATLTYGSITPTHNTVDILIESDALGTVAWGVALATAPRPMTLNEIRNLTRTSQVVISTANSPVTVNITRLTAETEYIAYAVLLNGSGTMLSDILPSPAFTTLAFPDITYGATTPTYNSVSFTIQSNTLGTIHWGLALGSASAPRRITAIQALSPSESITVHTANSPETISLSGLIPNTGYIVYAMLGDGSGTLISSFRPARNSFTTEKATLTVPVVSNITHSSVDFTLQSNYAGTLYYRVDKTSSSAPRSVSDLGGGLIRGQMLISTINSPVTINLAGLQLNTEYKVYTGLATRTGRGLQPFSQVTPSNPFTTLTAMLTYSAVTPTHNEASMTLQSNATGTLFYGLALATASVPTSLDDIRALSNRGMFTIRTVNSPMRVSFLRLQSNTEYKVYAVLVSGNFVSPAIYSDIEIQAFMTDNPMLTLSAPTSVAPFSASINVSSTHTGTLVYGLVLATASAPTSLDDIRALTPTGSFGVGPSPRHLILRNLEPNTEYKVYAVLVSGNFVSPAIYSDIYSSPAFSTDPGTLTYSNLAPTHNAFSATVHSNISGTVHYGAALATASAPATLTQIQALLSAGAWTIRTTSRPARIAVAGLTPNTEYIVYAVLVGSGDALLSSITPSTAFTTIPLAILTYGTATPTHNSVSMTLQSSALGSISYGAALATATAPTSLAGIQRLRPSSSVTISTINSPESISLANLQPNTEYKVYAGLRDNNGVLASDITPLTFTTLMTPTLTIVPSINETHVLSHDAGTFAIMVTANSAWTATVQAFPWRGAIDTDRGSASLSPVTVTLTYPDNTSHRPPLASVIFTLTATSARSVLNFTQAAPPLVYGTATPTHNSVSMTLESPRSGVLNYGAHDGSGPQPTGFGSVRDLIGGGTQTINDSDIGTTLTIEITGLTPNTQYTIYAVVNDGFDGFLLTAITQSESFTTLMTSLAILTYGTATPTHNSVGITLQSNTRGTIHYGVALATAEAPTDLAEIQNLNPSSTVVISTINSPEAINLTGLMPDTEYKLYAGLADGDGALASAVTPSDPFTTLMMPLAILTYGTTTPTHMTVFMTIQSNTLGTIHYGVAVATASAPTDLAGIQSLSPEGSFTIRMINTDVTISITGLSPETEYRIYAGLADGDGALASAITPSPAFTTLMTPQTPDVMVGTEANDALKGVIYPNPTGDVLYIQGIESYDRVDVYNVKGRLIQRQTEGRFINLANQPSGVYLIRVKQATTTLHKRIIKH